MHNDITARGYPLPHPKNQLKDDVYRIRDTILRLSEDLSKTESELSEAIAKLSDGQVNLATYADSAKIFVNPTADQWGFRTATFANHDSYVSPELGQTPLWELYGVGGAQWYNVLTFGHQNRLTQIAVYVFNGDAQNCTFMRSRHVDNNDMTRWQPWQEIPTNRYWTWDPHVHVDPINGDDVAGTGRESAPFRTLHKAFEGRVAGIVKHSLSVILAPGVYNLPTTLHINRIMGGGVELSAQDPTNKPIIQNAEGASFSSMVSTTDTNRVYMRNLVFRCREAGQVPFGVSLTNNNLLVHACDFDNFKTRTPGSSYGGAIYASFGGNSVNLSECTISNVTSAVLSNVSPSPMMIYKSHVENATYRFACTYGGVIASESNTFVNCGPDYLMGGSRIHESATKLLTPTAATWIPINGATTLPAGGTWAYATVTAPSTTGIVAGGTIVGATGKTGFAWRIQ